MQIENYLSRGLLFEGNSVKPRLWCWNTDPVESMVPDGREVSISGDHIYKHEAFEIQCTQQDVIKGQDE